MKNKLKKPTERQTKAFQHLKAGLTKQEAMLKAGYSSVSSRNPKVNLMDSAGVKTLIEQYKEEMTKAGINIEVLAEIEAAGLFDENGAVRLGYLKEAKKSLGLSQETERPLIQVNNIVGQIREKYK